MGARAGGLIAAAVVALSAFLPWATISSIFGSMSTAGIEGDGVFTLIGAIAVGTLFAVWKRPAVIVAAVVAGLVLVIAIIDLADVGRAVADIGNSGLARASTGIGLYLTALGAAVALVLAIVGQAGLRNAAPGIGWGAEGQLAPAGSWDQAGQTAPVTPDIGRGQSQYGSPQAPTPPPTSPAAAPPGWHPDPYGQAQWRYWDGVHWTEHVQGAR